MIMMGGTDDEKAKIEIWDSGKKFDSRGNYGTSGWQGKARFISTCPVLWHVVLKRDNSEHHHYLVVIGPEDCESQLAFCN
jgi:hypothetical protein